jgi:hypothetical protein
MNTHSSNSTNSVVAYYSLKNALASIVVCSVFWLFAYYLYKTASPQEMKDMYRLFISVTILFVIWPLLVFWFVKKYHWAYTPYAKHRKPLIALDNEAIMLIDTRIPWSAISYTKICSIAAGKGGEFKFFVVGLAVDISEIHIEPANMRRLTGSTDLISKRCGLKKNTFIHLSGVKWLTVRAEKINAAAQEYLSAARRESGANSHQ